MVTGPSSLLGPQEERQTPQSLTEHVGHNRGLQLCTCDVSPSSSSLRGHVCLSASSPNPCAEGTHKPHSIPPWKQGDHADTGRGEIMSWGGCTGLRGAWVGVWGICNHHSGSPESFSPVLTCWSHQPGPVLRGGGGSHHQLKPAGGVGSDVSTQRCT